MTTDRAAPTDEQIAEWLRLADAATEGPWISFDKPDIQSISARGKIDAVVHWEGFEQARGNPAKRRANAAFIAASRTAVPALVSKVKEQAAEIERLREALRPCANWLRYAFGNVSSVTSEKVKEHLPKIESALPEER